MSNKSLELLFNSGTRVKILKSLFRNSDKSFTVGELADLAQIKSNVVRKELRLLLDIGLLKIRKP